LTDGEEITLDVISEEIASKPKIKKEIDQKDDLVSVSMSLGFKEAKRDFERKYRERCLEQTSGNITQAATLLDMHRQSLQHKIKELGLTKKFVSE
jgi:DNA-binding NtrC family response regulator